MNLNEEKAQKLQALVDERFTPEHKACLELARKDLRRFLQLYGNYAQLAIGLEAQAIMNLEKVDGNPTDPPVAYGCHLDIDVEGGDVPDTCYIDTGHPEDCIFSARGDVTCKDQCPHWKPYNLIKASLNSTATVAHAQALARRPAADLKP